MNHAIEIKEEIHDLEDVSNINSNIEFVETKQVKSETFVDVSEIKTEKLDFSIEESNDKAQIKTDPLEVPKTVNKPTSAKETNSRLKGEEICSQCGMRFVNKEKLILLQVSYILRDAENELL